jgi:hypothetical protein
VGQVGAALGGAGDAEVDDARTVAGEQDVARLEVPVHQPGPVDGGQRRRQPGGQVPHGGGRQRPGRVDGFLQRRPGDEHRSEPRRRRVRVGVHHRRGVGARDQPGDLDLAAEPFAEAGIVREPAVHLLDGGRPAVGGDPEQHPAHPALADRGEQPVPPGPRRLTRTQRLHTHLRGRS